VQEKRKAGLKDGKVQYWCSSTTGAVQLLVQFDYWCSLITGAVRLLVQFYYWCSLITGEV
jgi:hypothetical protein